MFRITLTSPANWLVDTLHIDEKSVVAGCLKLFVPFFISGAYHACGSYTMLGDSRPMNSFLFFALQPVGIVVQSTTCWILYHSKIMPGIPCRLRETANITFTAIWLLKTFPLLADDFARGGAWLAEPFPISLLQKVGLGTKARNHQLWLGWGIKLHMGHRSWQVGLAV